MWKDTKSTYRVTIHCTCLHPRKAKPREQHESIYAPLSAPRPAYPLLGALLFQPLLEHHRVVDLAILSRKKQREIPVCLLNEFL